MNFHWLDWMVLIGTLTLIVLFGLYKSRTSRNLEGYFLSDREMPWWLVLLSVMGTQASAITFLTAPGQAYTDGMRFVQYYFGLPLAMVILCISFVPIFHRLKVFTAYEFLEKRFDLKTRSLTSFLFLLSRGVSTGISVIAPSIVLHSLFGWNFYATNLAMGGILIIYTTTGGAKAVAYTQQLQFLIIYAAMFLAAWFAISHLPAGVSFTDALHLGGKSGKLNVITTGIKENGFDWKDKYNIWSGLIGGLFLALSYFGTDQSQVGRYLTAKSTRESRLGLLLNGMVKVPLQFSMLLIGIMVFAFYQFAEAPAFFNAALEKQVMETPDSAVYKSYTRDYKDLQAQKKQLSIQLVNALHDKNEQEEKRLGAKLKEQEYSLNAMRLQIREVIKKAVPGEDGNDTNYIFLRFVSDYLPTGLIGLIIAIIFLAAWGSIAAALNALASCTMVDFHLRFSRKQLTEEQQYKWSKFYTVLWGLFSVFVALFAYNFGNSLIEAVNILGSWFYGTILGIFLVAFFFKKIGGTAVFWAAVLAEVLVISIYFMDIISFLWLNLIGAAAVILLGGLLQWLLKGTVTSPEAPQVQS